MALFGEVQGDQILLMCLFIWLAGKGMQKAWDVFDKDGKIIDAARNKAEEKVKQGGWKWW